MVDDLDEPSPIEILRLTEEVVRLVAELRVVLANHPRYVIVSDSEQKKQRHSKAFREWFPKLCAIHDDAVERCEFLLGFAGAGMGTGIREWISRSTCQTDGNPYNDQLLATVIAEAQAIGRLAQSAALPTAAPVAREAEAVAHAARSCIHEWEWVVSHWLNAIEYEKLRQRAADTEKYLDVQHLADKCDQYDALKSKSWAAALAPRLLLIHFGKKWGKSVAAIEIVGDQLGPLLPSVCGCGLDSSTMPPDFDSALAEARAIQREAETRVALAEAGITRYANADSDEKADAEPAASDEVDGVPESQSGGGQLNGVPALDSAVPSSALQVPKKPMTWQEAKKVAENHCVRGVFPGVNALARIVRDKTGRTCSKTTILKAIRHSARLRARQAEHGERAKSVSAGTMTPGRRASAKQSRERDPAEAASTDEIFRALVERADESERAYLNSMTDAQRQKIAGAMDEESIRELFKVAVAVGGRDRSRREKPPK